MSGLKPDSSVPATSADGAHQRDRGERVGERSPSALPANTSPRSSERVRIVFSVPLWLSAATMSPATSAVISGNRQIEPNSSRTSGSRQAGFAHVAAEGDVGRSARSGRRARATKMIGTTIGGAEAEVGALLGASLRSSQR